MTIETSAGITYEARLLTRLTLDKSLLIQITGDHRPLSEIARELEGLAFVEGGEPSRRYEDCGTLQSISRVDQEVVQLRLYSAEF